MRPALWSVETAPWGALNSSRGYRLNSIRRINVSRIQTDQKSDRIQLRPWRHAFGRPSMPPGVIQASQQRPRGPPINDFEKA